uniref:Uncharacterized protein n=2 Tax=Clytia hemisphaerica TaxID=252671 RepID=A0A7M6DM06_9CNID
FEDLHHHQLNGRISGTPSIIAPPSHPFPPPSHHPSHPVGASQDKNQQDLLLKTSHGHHHPREHHLPPQQHAPHPPTSQPTSNEQQEGAKHKHPAPSPNVFHFGNERAEEHHMHRKPQGKFEPRSSRENYEPSNHQNRKDQRPSIGLVHPQPQRKHRDEEIVKSSQSMNSLHFSPRDSVTVHSLSPTELSRYGSSYPPGRGHVHGPQTSCPVHGQESSHPHDERNGRPPNLPFDAPHGFHGLHGPHPRFREDIYMRRHSLDRKEHLPPPPHHALEEDLRRRGMDFRGFAGLPPHLLDEQYRRHLLNGTHEHPPPFKEPGHGQVFVPPHFYYGREYPLPVDPYHPHALSAAPSELLHRYGGAPPPVSPRLLEAYRRNEHGVLSSREFEAAERRYEERRESADQKESVIRPASIDLYRKKSAENHMHDRRKHSISLDKKPVVHEKEEPPRMKMPIFKGLECNNNNIKPHPKQNGTSHQANSITSLLNSKLPNSKSELDAASILANMNRISQSPACSDEQESITSSSAPEVIPPTHIKQQPLIKEEDKENVEIEQPEEKLNYLLNLGLVMHSRKRILEEEFERKRWDRKFRKYRGRPKKRSKRENTEEGSVNGDLRPGSDLDFYNGPMTRHKQQLLQEQENLLEQIQKQNSTENNSENVQSPGENSNPETNKDNQRPASRSSGKSKKSPRNSPRKDSISKSSSNGDVAVENNDNQTTNVPTPTVFIKSEENLSTSSRKSTPTPTNHHAPKESSVIGTHDNSHRQDERRQTNDRSDRLMTLIKDKVHPVPAPSPSSASSSHHRHHPHHHLMDKNHLLHRQPSPHPSSSSSHEHLKRHSSSSANNSAFNDHVPRPSSNHHASYAEHVEEMRKLDSSLFGRHMEPTQDHFARWPGVNYIQHAYTSYLKECDLQRQHLLQSYEELQRESRSLHLKRDFLEKDMLVYDQRRARISDRRRNMQVSIEGVHKALRSMSDL